MVFGNQTNNTGFIRFLTRSGGSDVERIRLINNGSIGVGVTSPNASAILDITSTTQGVLFPRMTGLQAEAIATPADGLMVYANNGNGVTINSIGFWGRVSGAWVRLN
jgi:hypothetical protein